MAVRSVAMKLESNLLLLVLRLRHVQLHMKIGNFTIFGRTGLDNQSDGDIGISIEMRGVKVNVGLGLGRIRIRLNTVVD